jgi:lipopolysaccharide/colanic/teichoic acid biosynthesis glycosyltransferase
MVVSAEKLGAAVTAEHDPRITRIGRWLRKTKLDELPQLLNVFFGDMSFVGPRPEVPYYVNLWSEADRELILSVKPGITDYATLYYHDEQALLAKVDNPEKIYLEEVMPHKVEMYKNYVKDSNFWLDLKIILATLGEIIGLSSEWLIKRT